MTDSAKLQHCPNCQKPMRLARVIPKLAGHPEIESFKCHDCGEVLTKTKDDK